MSVNFLGGGADGGGGRGSLVLGGDLGCWWFQLWTLVM